MVLYPTPLLLWLILVEIADLVFAIDSVAAILGLRALYFALAAVVHRFHDLKYALAMVLIFIGAKIFLRDWLFDGKVPASNSLGVTGGLLAGACCSRCGRRAGPRVHDQGMMGSARSVLLSGLGLIVRPEPRACLEIRHVRSPSQPLS